MLKFIANTIITAAKACAVCALIVHITDLDYKVAKLEDEIRQLKAKG